MTKILLVGAGGHARAVIDVIEQQAEFAIGGLVGLAREAHGRVLGYAVLGTDEDLPRLVRRHPHALVSIGQIKDFKPRTRAYDRLKRCGYRLPTIVSPTAHVSKHAIIGEGTIVMHGAVINAGASVGRNCIINSQSLIEHDAVIGDHCHVATAAAINSGVSVGDCTFIGSGVIVKQLIKIGERSVIGMGQRVLADCRAGTWLPRRKI